jgi:hypothetical protein
MSGALTPYRQVPRLGQKRNAGLTYSILAAISFKIISLVKYRAIPLFFPRFKTFQVPLAVPFVCQTLFQNVVPSVSFSIWETK